MSAMTRSQTPRLFLTEAETAGLLRVHPSTLGRLAKRGQSPIAPVVVGTRRMYPCIEVHKLAGVSS